MDVFRRGLPVFLLAGVAPGCGERGLSEDEAATLRTMAAPVAGLPVAASPTNAWADDSAAAALGQRFFFDRGFSSDASVACADCHQAEHGWSDGLPVSEGVDGRRGARHSMPVRGAALQRWWFWDGRADSMWSQAILAMESSAEMDFSRAEAAHYVAAVYGAEYEAVFGPIGDLSLVPARAQPGDAAWAALPADVRTRVERVFANIGKAIEAYERRLGCHETRFDRWARGELSMSAAESRGASAFVREGCVDCHSGVAFSDGEFHNIGIGSNGPGPDRGRAQGIEALLLNPFNGAGAYSDDVGYGAARLTEAQRESAVLGAFRTPSLRGVAQRAHFGHRGDRASLGDFLRVYNRVRSQDSAVGPLDDRLDGINLGRERNDVEAFLRMLDCPPVPEHLTDPAALAVSSSGSTGSSTGASTGTSTGASQGASLDPESSSAAGSANENPSGGSGGSGGGPKKKGKH